MPVPFYFRTDLTSYNVLRLPMSSGMEAIMCKDTEKADVKDQVSRLAAAFLTLRTAEECEAFFADLLTSRELEDISSRLEVARLLKLGVNYNDIAAKTGASTATISRVSKCLSGELGGYRTVLSRLEGNAVLSECHDQLSTEEIDAINAVIACFKNKK